MQSRHCAACGQAFWPRPQVPEQGYCGKAACQRERRRRWQQAKRCGDADYRDNEMRAERAWRKRHPEYWREYRRTHPRYTERNRAQQHQRDSRRGEHRLANMDASTPVLPVLSGTYRLTPVAPGDLANMDVCTVEITLVSAP
jgi:hypothetical protein